MPEQSRFEFDDGAIEPQETADARGTLDVNCIPWCQITIDGKDTGRTSPALGISLTAGKHRLKVENPPSGVQQERDISIRAGTTTREIVKF